MRSAEEILNESLPFGQMIKEAVITAINQARKEAIEECIQIVNTNSIINANNFIQPKLRKLIKELK